MTPSMLTGSVLRGSRSGPGVPGLRVELRVATAGGLRVAGRTVSDREGRFTLPAPAPGAARIELAYIDRTGAVVHVDPLSTRGRGALRARSVVARAALAEHEASPILLERVDGPLVDTDAMLAGLSQVLEGISPAGTPLHDRLMLGARCPLPPLALTTHLYGDAFGVLEGDVEATRRFLDTLDTLPPLPIDAAAARRGPCGGHRHVGAAGPLPARGAADAPLIPRERALPVIAAAAYLERTGLFGTDLTRRAIVPLCHIERFGGLVTLGLQAASEPRALQRLQGVLELGFPFPECPPPTIPEFPPLVECEPHLPCLENALEAFEGARGYVISAVSPAVACPGDTIVITGAGFGTTPARVRFGGVTTTATSWSDTSITVVVPAGAGNPLSLDLPPYSRLVCGRLVEATPTGRIDAGFEVGIPEILAFFAGSRPQAVFCVEPGAPIPITWRVRGAVAIRVAVTDDAGGIVAVSDPAPANGTFATLSAPAVSSPRTWIARITASGTCGGPAATAQIEIRITRDRILTVHGLEITQAIQHYRAQEHLTDAADRGPDNSLRLVADKTAWVRAYLRSGLDPSFSGGPISGVDGTLTVERRTAGVWGVVATLPSQNGPVDALESFPSYDAERGDIDSTLNFVVPAAVMTGLLRLTVRVTAPDEPCARTTASAQVTADVNLRQTLNAAFITVAYNGLDAARMNTLNLAAPTLADCTAETAWAMRTYPVSGAPNVRIAGTFTTATPLDDARTAPGACSPNWGPLLTTLAALVTADQALNPGGNWVYYGIIAGGIPVNVPGCSGGATGGLVGQPMTYAHEIGHAFGLPHARCGNAGAGNVSYPVYEPYDQPVDLPAMPIGNTVWTMASIGEYGLDINNGDIANPATAHDFMSYCGPRWISVFTHDFLVNSPRLAPQTFPTGAGAPSRREIDDGGDGLPPGPGDVRPRITILGSVDREGRVEVASVARLESGYLAGDAADSGLRAQLVDEDGRVLAEDVVHRFGTTGCCGDGPLGAPEDGGGEGFLIRATLDDVALGAALRILRREDVVWERRRPPAPPKAGKIRGGLDDRGDLRVAWSARRGKKAHSSAWVRWSGDGGRTWGALTVGVAGDEVLVPRDQLPSGTILLQVLVHDGFSTATAVSDAIVIPAAPPSVAILYPREGGRAYADRRLHLWAAVCDPGPEAPDDDAVVWFIDDEEVGRGADVWVRTPSPGRHKVRVEASGRAGVGIERSSVVVPARER